MKAYAVTDKGKVRSNNEDTIFSSSDPVGLLPNLFVVADGVGGHNAGEKASKAAVEEVYNSVRDTNYIDPVDIMKEALRRANRTILSEARRDTSLKGMGTTLVMASMVGSALYAANIGDSRLYVVKDRLHQVTRDHSLVEDMVREGKIIRGDELYNSQKHIITKALGMASEVLPDIFVLDVDVGDLLLLCSDGLTDMLTEEEILGIIQRTDDPQDMPGALLMAACNNGGKDNISVIIVDPELSEVDIWC